MISLEQKGLEVLEFLRAERRKLDSAIESLEAVFQPAKSIPPQATAPVREVPEGRLGTSPLRQGTREQKEVRKAPESPAKSDREHSNGRPSFTIKAKKEMAVLRDGGMRLEQIRARFFDTTSGAKRQPSDATIIQAARRFGLKPIGPRGRAPRVTATTAPHPMVPAANPIERAPSVALPVVTMRQPAAPISEPVEEPRVVELPAPVSQVAGPVDISKVKWACVIGMDAPGIAALQVLREHHIQAVIQDRRSGLEFRSAVRLFARLSVTYFFTCREIQQGYDLYVSTDGTPLSASLPQMTPLQLAQAFPDCPFARELERLVIPQQAAHADTDKEEESNG